MVTQVTPISSDADHIDLSSELCGQFRQPPRLVCWYDLEMVMVVVVLLVIVLCVVMVVVVEVAAVVVTPRHDVAMVAVMAVAAAVNPRRDVAIVAVMAVAVVVVVVVVVVSHRDVVMTSMDVEIDLLRRQPAVH